MHHQDNGDLSLELQVSNNESLEYSQSSDQCSKFIIFYFI